MGSAATSCTAQGCRRLPFISDRERWIVQDEGMRVGHHPSCHRSYLALGQ